MSERFKGLRLALAGGIALTSAAVVGCRESKDEPISPTPVIRTHTPEVTIAPTIVNTPENVDSQIELSDVDRSNYLKIFETSIYEFSERDVSREPTDDPGNFVRTYEILENGVERRGVTIVKKDKNSGVEQEIKSFQGFVSEVGEIDSPQKATALIFAKEQWASDYVDPQLPPASEGIFNIGVLFEGQVECALAKYQVDRSGNITRVASEIVKVNTEGECDR